MTSYEMISNLASRLGDEAYRDFTELELRQWLNDGQADVQRRLEGINADWYLVNWAMNITNGTTTYALPTNCKNVYSVRIDKRGIGGTSAVFQPCRWLPVEEWAKGRISSDWVASANDPLVMHLGTSIYIQPTPDSTMAAGMYIFYGKRVADLTTWDDTETSEIRPEYHDLIVGYAEIVARRRRGEDTAQLQQIYEAAIADIKAGYDKTVMKR